MLVAHAARMGRPPAASAAHATTAAKAAHATTAAKAAEAEAASAGAGAQVPSRLGEASQQFQWQAHTGAPVPRGLTPAEVVQQKLACQESTRDASLYSQATLEWMHGRVVTPAQCKLQVSTYRDCPVSTTRIHEATGRAVVRYPVAQRLCAPWLLTREDDRWKIDLQAMSGHFRFNMANEWRFIDAARDGSPYAFGFADWVVDANGWPVSEPAVAAPSPR
jgi:hypothetical protein